MDGSRSDRFFRTPLIPIVLALLGTLASVHADPVEPNGVWIELAPPMRTGHTAIYDPIRDRMILYGGGSQQMWQLSLSGTPRWSILVTAGPLPPSSSGQTAIYDPVRDRLITFPGTGRSDVWALSLSGTPTWSQIVPVGTGPRARSAHTAIYDPVRDRMIICGGYGGSLLVPETWALSFAPVPTWSKITPAGPAPSPLYYHSAIYDPVGDQMIITGGTSLSETWALSLSGPATWTHWASADDALFDRYGHTAIYDPEGDRMIIFGGHSDLMYTEGGADYGDLKALDLRGSRTWYTLIPRGPARVYHAGAYDPVRKRLVIHGGSNLALQTSVLSDAWEASLGSNPAWTSIVSETSPPIPIKDRAAIYDPVRDRLVAYGGSWVPCGSGSPFGIGGDAQGLPLGSEPFWAVIGAPPPPGVGLYGYTAVYDPVRDRMVVFGQALGMLRFSGIPRWATPWLGGSWPASYVGHSAVYDPFNDRMLVYGGTSAAGAVAELWSLSFVYPIKWIHLNPPGAAPPALTGHAAVLDPVRRRMLVIALPDIWALSVGGPDEWSQLAPAGSPPSSAPLGAIYDPVLDRVIVLARNGASEGVWALNLSPALQWQVLSPLGTAPAPRTGAPAVYDAARGRVILYGGWVPGPGCSGQYWTDLWALQLVPPGLLAVPATLPVLRVSEAIPNPTWGASSVRLDLPNAAFVRVGVFDVTGRLVRQVVSRGYEPGSHEISWDGTDLAGRSAPAGIYFVHVAAGSERFVRRIARLR